MFDTIHPVVVHFPIALLTIYSLLEIASLFPKVRHNRTVRYIKLFLIVVGWVGIQAALSSGEAMEDAGYGAQRILERHENFGNLSNWLYGLATLGYVSQWILYDGVRTSLGAKMIGSWAHRLLQKIAFLYKRSGVLYILAIG